MTPEVLATKVKYPEWLNKLKQYAEEVRRSLRSLALRLSGLSVDRYLHRTILGSFGTSGLASSELRPSSMSARYSGPGVVVGLHTGHQSKLKKKAPRSKGYLVQY